MPVNSFLMTNGVILTLWIFIIDFNDPFREKILSRNVTFLYNLPFISDREILDHREKLTENLPNSNFRSD